MSQHSNKRSQQDSKAQEIQDLQDQQIKDLKADVVKHLNDIKNLQETNSEQALEIQMLKQDIHIRRDITGSGQEDLRARVEELQQQLQDRDS